MRRRCVNCHAEYYHDSITASGLDASGERHFIMVCSFGCLRQQLYILELAHEDAPTTPPAEETHHRAARSSVA